MAAPPDYESVDFLLLYFFLCDNAVVLLFLNSAEHEILNANKYENIKTDSICQAQISL